MIHGIGFGALYLLACSGAIVELWRRYSPAAEAPVTARDEAFLSPALAIYAETMVDVRRGEAAQAATNLAWGAEIYGSFIEAMGGELEIRAIFPDGSVRITQFSRDQ